MRGPAVRRDLRRADRCDTATGTRADPLKTIGAGITKAVDAHAAVGVYVQTGEYDETVAMTAGRRRVRRLR